MKIKKWEICIAVFLLVFVCAQALIVNISKEQKELSDKIIRMHVIAHSNSAEDQKLKLEVRDAVNSYLTKYIESCDEKESAAELITEHYNAIEDVAQKTIYECGYDYGVDITLGDEFYPTREYESFSLPAGKYTSLQIKIGEAEGQNWWCVVFPPLCTSVASYEELTELSFTDEEIEFITSNSRDVVFKFKILELISDIIGNRKN